MFYRYLEILTISQQLDELNRKFNTLTDKFTSNGLGASAITLIFFIVICLAITKFSSK